MKYFILVFTLLLSTWAYAQPSREEVALKDETAFDISFRFQFDTITPTAVTFSRDENTDYIQISGVSNCRRNNMGYRVPIADLYVYDQFLEYLQNLNIANYQPTATSPNIDAKLQVQASISIPSTWTVNAFVFQHHPDSFGEEKQMLTFVVDILNDNAGDECSRDLVAKLQTYVNGE